MTRYHKRIPACGAMLAAIVIPIVAASNATAGKINYVPGTGGTFDPSTPTLFTFTGFTGLNTGVNYTQAKVYMRVVGTQPTGGFTVGQLSLANPTASLADISFQETDTSWKTNDFVTLPTPVTTDNLSAVKLTFMIPTLSVPNGWKLEASLQFYDGDRNDNPTSTQFATASSQAVPEPGSIVLLGSVLAGVGGHRLRKWHRSKKEVGAA